MTKCPYYLCEFVWEGALACMTHWVVIWQQRQWDLKTTVICSWTVFKCGTWPFFDSCAFPSSCCIRTLIRFLKLKRPNNGRCDRSHTFSYLSGWSHQFVLLCASFLCMFSFIIITSWFALWLFSSPLSTSEGSCTSLWTLFRYLPDFLNHKFNSLLIWFIISWMNSSSRLILSGLLVSWLLLLQNINDYLSAALLSQWCRQTSAVFRGHTVELCYSSRLPKDFRLITALNPRGY